MTDTDGIIRCNCGSHGLRVYEMDSEVWIEWWSCEGCHQPFHNLWTQLKRAWGLVWHGTVCYHDIQLNEPEARQLMSRLQEAQEESDVRT